MLHNHISTLSMVFFRIVGQQLFSASAQPYALPPCCPFACNQELARLNVRRKELDNAYEARLRELEAKQTQAEKLLRDREQKVEAREKKVQSPS